MNVRLLREAEAEVDAAARWYEARREGLGDRFLSELQQVLDRIRLRPLEPQVLRLGKREVRRRLLKHFPYAVVYEVRESECLVVAVAHLARRPGYWRSRKG